jgi:hypothetical protein
MSFINDERKRIQFAKLMKELAKHDDLKVSMDYGDHEWYGYNKDSKLMYVALDTPEHLLTDEYSTLCMTARFECGGAIIRYTITHGDNCAEHEFYNYEDMMGCGICKGCGVYDWVECELECPKEIARKIKVEEDKIKKPIRIIKFKNNNLLVATEMEKEEVKLNEDALMRVADGGEYMLVRKMHSPEVLSFVMPSREDGKYYNGITNYAEDLLRWYDDKIKEESDSDDSDEGDKCIGCRAKHPDLNNKGECEECCDWRNLYKEEN